MSKQLGKRPMSSSTPVSDGSVGNDALSESRLSGKKVKLPVFEGEDPVAWITRAEIYFDVQNTTEEMKVKLARLSMEGSTIHWFNLLLETEDELSWVKLKKALIARYGGRRLENPFEEYVEAFELLSSQVGRLPEEQYLGYFMSGLKPKIRRRVRTLNPQSRIQMMRMAKDVEEELKEGDEDEGCVGKKGLNEKKNYSDWVGSLTKNRSGSFQRDPTRTGNTGWTHLNSRTGSIGSNVNSSSSLVSSARKTENPAAGDKWKNLRSIHNEEMAERRAKGLCFKCGGKFHPTLHKCLECSMHLLILGEGETMTEEGEIVALEVAEAKDNEGRD